ncbi:hypothetical protein [Flyfo microvirus Tbat2_43]|nr:hypothetical protein [Flyfo microvirus Tbat2_43]
MTQKPQPTVKCAACARRRENIKQAAIKTWRKIKGKK